MLPGGVNRAGARMVEIDEVLLLWLNLSSAKRAGISLPLWLIRLSLKCELSSCQRCFSWLIRVQRKRAKRRPVAWHAFELELALERWDLSLL